MDVQSDRDAERHRQYGSRLASLRYSTHLTVCGIEHENNRDRQSERRESAKTTTVINLGAALAVAGKRVLIIDFDPQGNASTSLGITPEERTRQVQDILEGSVSVESAAMKTPVRDLLIVPATSDLASADIEMSKSPNRLNFLKSALNARSLSSAKLDYVLIDCPPSLNLLTVNAMTAAESVLVPLQAEFLALEGLSQLILTISEDPSGRQSRIAN